MRVVKGVFVDTVIRIGIGDGWIEYLLRLFDPTYQLLSQCECLVSWYRAGSGTGPLEG